MKFRGSAVALGLIAAGCAGQAQDVSLYSLTTAQMMKTEQPGFGNGTYAPATEFLGIDVNKLGNERLSMHIFGWGTLDLADQSNPSVSGKSTGYLNTAYLQYRFPTANAEIKVGRMTVYNGIGPEQVDGVAGSTDLVNGFRVSGFGGQPVWYKVVDPANQRDYEYQRNMIVGGRLSWRGAKFGEIGLDYVQDGSHAAKDLSAQPPHSSTDTLTDYTRRQMGFDVKIAPVASFDFTARTVQDLAQHPDPAPGKPTPSKTAENDLTANWRAMDKLAISAGYIERNFYAYYAGTNMPNLFKQDESDKFKATYGSVSWGSADDWSVSGDFKHTERLTYGNANRAGFDLRWAKDAFRTGFGYHRINAADVVLTSGKVPYYSLSHSEYRAWAMYDKDKLSVSLDGIWNYFNDTNNPNLSGQQNIYEVVGSVGYQATSSIKVSGDLSYGANPMAKKEVMGMLRFEYRFSSASKGGSK
jgi:hypothetical protein